MELVSFVILFIEQHPTIPLGIALFVLLMYTLHLHRKIYRFTRGANALSLEDIMKNCVDGVAKIEERNELISKHALLLEEKIAHAIRNVETTRYKAFETNGSNQSFSIAFVNEKGNGVLLSTLHAHDRVSTFAKPVINYESTYDLTDEEVHVLREAKSKHKLSSKIDNEE